MKEVEQSSTHQGNWYRISEILTIMIYGLLSSLQTIEDIHEWVKIGADKSIFPQTLSNMENPMQSTFL